MESHIQANQRLPILPGRLQPSTFSVYVLNYCVRNGNRWNHIAIVTESVPFQSSLYCVVICRLPSSPHRKYDCGCKLCIPSTRANLESILYNLPSSAYCVVTCRFHPGVPYIRLAGENVRVPSTRPNLISCLSHRTYKQCAHNS